jgi:hypothetical protein
VSLRRGINFFGWQLQMSLGSSAKLYLDLVSSFRPLSKIDLHNPQNFMISSTFTQPHDRSSHPLLISSLASFEISTINNIQDGELNLQWQERGSMTVEIRPADASSRDRCPHFNLRKWHPKTCADNWIPSQ